MDLDEEIRRRNRRYLQIGLSLLIGAWLVLAWIVGPAFALLWMAPAIGSLGAYWLVQHWAGMPVRWLKRRAYAGQDGVFHAFDDLQVRVRWNGVCCEVAVIDVLNVLHLPKAAHSKTIRVLAHRYPAGVYQCTDNEWWFSEMALLEWLAERGQKLDQHVLRFRRWFERETFPALRNKVALGRVKAER